jgi:hypothetical protein
MGLGLSLCVLAFAGRIIALGSFLFALGSSWTVACGLRLASSACLLVIANFAIRRNALCICI